MNIVGENIVEYARHMLKYVGIYDAMFLPKRWTKNNKGEENVGWNYGMNSNDMERGQNGYEHSRTGANIKHHICLNIKYFLKIPTIE